MKIKLSILLLASFFPLNIAFASNHDFYLKGALDIAGFKHHKAANPTLLTGKATHKGDVIGALGFAGGYYLNEKFRTEAEVKIYSEGKLESRFNSKFSNNFNKVTKKFTITTIMLGGYADLFDWGTAKIFIGGKAGITQIKEKINSDYVFVALGDSINFSYKNKQSNNFGYGVVTGVNFPLSAKVKTDIALSYNDYGKSKSLIRMDAEYGKTAYKSINLEVGIRFDL